MSYPKETYVPFIGGAVLGAVGMVYVVAKVIDMPKALENSVYNWVNHILGDNPGYHGHNYIKYSDRVKPDKIYKVKDIVVPTRVEANDLLDRLLTMVSSNDSVSVSDLYTLVGIADNFDDSKYGWTDLNDIKVTRTYSGFKLDLPETKYIRRHYESKS